MSINELPTLKDGDRVKVKLDSGYIIEGIVYSVKRMGAFVRASMRWSECAFFLPKDIERV